ncbi:hypothetical protein [Rhodoferax sp. PAMC 29310]|uniref:hypothetical protein n=1 Tax=Rhodoferax sp. PAMC 29310 TaxID=2822760 RepID=UPI001B32D2F9|nr:hypothetical protein [Rhodoferax sp. PAMC 29310]
MNLSSKSKKFGQSPVAAACVSLVMGMASTSALAQVASFGINFPTATATTIKLGNGTYGLNQDFTGVSGMSGTTIPVQSVQTLYSTTMRTLTANVNMTTGAGGILNTQSGGGKVTANVSNNSISASGTGNQLTLASGGTAATIDLGLMATNKSIGALAVQFLGSQNSGGGQVNVQANVSGSTVGALFTKMAAAPIAVNSNEIAASATLNEATTVVAGAVPLGFANSRGGSSTIGFTGTTVTGGGSVSGDSTATLSINTLQGTVNGGISAGSAAGSYAALTDNTIALKSQETGNYVDHYDIVGNGYVPIMASPDLSSPLTLNNNTQSAAFTGNKATNLLQADASSNAFSGSASVTNAQANVETLGYLAANTGPTALISNSQIIADLTYVGVPNIGTTSSTDLTSSLSVSGTALAPQSISAQSIGNAAGSLSSAGLLTSSGNAIEFNSSNVNLTGSRSATGVNVGAVLQTAGADIIVNSAQVNQRPNTTSGSGVSSLVSGSGITAAMDVLTATGSVAVNHDALTSGATGNLAGNLINAKANNVNASMAVVGTQQNTNAAVLAQNISSSIGAGVGDAAVTTNYTVAERAVTTAVLGSITVNNGAIGAVAQGNLAANNLLVAAGGTLTAQISGGAVSNSVSGGGATANAGLVAVNVQGNTASAAEASVSGSSIFIAGVDQAGDNQGNLVPLGAATLSASSNRISALAQGNNGGTNIGVTVGNAIALTAAAANSQNNNSTSPVTATVESSGVVVRGLSSDGTTIVSNSNTLVADATGNLGVNAISISGGSTVDGSVGVNTSDLQSLQGNGAAIKAAITAGAGASGIGVQLGVASLNSSSNSFGYSTTENASGTNPYTSSAVSATTGNFTDMLGRDITTVTGATLAVNSSTVAANATANQVNNSASLSGTTIGSIAPVASVIGNTQNNSGAVGSSVTSTDVGVRLVDQSNTVTSAPTYTNSATTTNSFDSDPTPGVNWSDVNLSNASAVAANSVSGSAAGSITAIDTTTASVSSSTLAAASSGNVAGNLLRLNGTDVTLPSGAALAVANTQTNNALGVLISSVSGANVGVLVGDASAGVTGTGISTLIGTVSATVLPTQNHPPSTYGIFNGSGSATISTPVVGSMAATGINALTATVDNSVLSATSIANSADNRIIVGATALAAAGAAHNALITNSQSNAALFSANLSTVNLGVVLANVTADQTTTGNGSATTRVTSTNTNVGSSISTVNGAVASTTLSASGSATALGISGSTVSVQGSALTATAKGNTVSNVIDLGSTVATAFGVQINNVTNGVGQTNIGSGLATLGDVRLGTVLDDVAATSTSTSTANATVSGSATDVTQSSVTNATATTSGSATAVATSTGLRNSTSTVSGNSLTAIGFGNEAINVVSGSGTVIGAVSNQAAANVISSQINTGYLTASVGLSGVVAAPIQLGTVVGAVTSIGSALVTSTASGSASALATDPGTNGESTLANFASTAVAIATATVNDTGISGLTAATDGNRIEAANTGNSAVNAIRLASTAITGSTGAETLANRNSQVNNGGLSASVANVGLGVLLTSVDATGTANGSSSATAVATATDSNTSAWASGSSTYTTNSASASASGDATTVASGSATAMGIEASNASVASNVLRAANTGNSATTVTSLSASSLTGVVGSTTVSGVSSQTNVASAASYGTLIATLGGSGGVVTVGVSGGAVTATFNASGSAKATSTGSTTAYNWYDADAGAPVVNASASNATPTLLTTATATANATATATGMSGSTFNVLSNQLSATNVGNSAYTSAVLDGTVLGTTLAPVSAMQSNTQTNGLYGYGTGIATASNIMLGVLQADVSANASGSASYTSSTGSNTANATAFAYGIVNSTLSVGGTQAAPQTVTAQSIGNLASTLIAVTQSTGAGPSGSATLAVTNVQDNYASQLATVGGVSGAVTVGVKVGDVTATADANATQTYLTGITNWPIGYAETARANAVGISGSSVAVQFNQLAALSYGNSASNSVASSTSTLLGGSLVAVPTFSLGNTQTNLSPTDSIVADVDIGVVVGDVMNNANGWLWSYGNSVAINAAQLNVSNNQSLATSMGNVADNRAVVSAGVAGSTALPFSSLVASGQASTGAQTALVDLLRVGVFTGQSNDDGIRNSSLTVAGNQVQTATYGNQASNVNEVLASNTANIGAVATRNTQDNVGILGSNTISNTTVGVGIERASSTALYNTPTTVQSNTLAALSYGNSATNSTVVSGGTTLTAISVATAFETSNTQTNAASMVSLADTIQVGVVVGGGGYGGTGINNSPVVVKDNAVSVLSYANQASNALSLSAGNVIDGNSPLAQVSNSQTNRSAGTAASTLQKVDVGVLVNAYSANANNSAVTVDGNRLTAASYLNTASNTLSLAAQVLAVPATVTSTQSNDASGLGKISGVNVGVLPEAGAAFNPQILNNVTSTVSNNALNAQAGGNTAQNVLNATASATIANAGPSFQVLNAQSNNGVMTALLENVHVGNWGDSNSQYGYYNGYNYTMNLPTTMTVSMNTAVASAYGNTASNALNMNALTGSSNSASTGLSNSQSNTASLSATVSGVLMGVGSGQGTGTVSVSGNSIVASTVGNAASNRVGIVR